MNNGAGGSSWDFGPSTDHESAKEILILRNQEDFESFPKGSLTLC
jgi:hypothetical protein